MSDDREQLTVYVSPETRDVIESMRSRSEQRADMWDMSVSEAARRVLEHGIEHIEEAPLEELTNDLELRLWANQQRHERRKREARFADMAGGWRGRVRDRMDRRLSGSDPYPPEKIETLCESYMGDIEDWELDEDMLPKHRAWLEQRLDAYRDAYRAKQTVPEDCFSEIDSVDLGSDLLRIRDQFGELIEDLLARAQGDQFDPDAILRSLAADHAISEEAVELILEQLIGEDTDPRRALSQGEGLPEMIDPEALEEWGADPELPQEEIEDTQAVYDPPQESGVIEPESQAVEDDSQEIEPDRAVTVTRDRDSHRVETDPDEIDPDPDEIDLDEEDIEELRDMAEDSSNAEIRMRASMIAEDTTEAEMLLEEIKHPSRSRQEGLADD